MALSIGLVGLPNAGKSTLLNALTNLQVTTASYPFTTIEPNIGVVPVEDERLDQLVELIKPERKVAATVEFVDVAGLVKGASRGEGLGAQFLGHLRNVDAIAMVLRVFQSTDVSHTLGGTDPERDADVLWLELGLADLAIVQRRLSNIRQAARSGDREARQEIGILERIEGAVGDRKELGQLLTDDLVAQAAHRMQLLTAKPAMYVLNIGEEDQGQAAQVSRMEEMGLAANTPVCSIFAQQEDELNRLEPAEATEYRQILEMSENALTILVRTAYSLLELSTFFTIDGPEVRAWTVREGTTAPAAAGNIHSDFERGFIRAEVIEWQEFVRAGSIANARQHGKMRLEGKEYVVRDGDVVHFRFAL